MAKTYEIKLDVEKVLYSPMEILFHVSNSDVGSIDLAFEITQDETPFDLTGKTIQLAIQQPSKKVLYQDLTTVDAVNGKASATLVQNAYSEVGIHIAEVYIKDIDETIVISPFYFNSWESVTATETVDGGGTSEVYWNDILNKPFSYPPESHVHSISDVTGLQAELDSKADVGTGGGTLEPHTHAIADVTGLQAELDGKVEDVHTHGIADVTGLQSALDGKVDDAEMTLKADADHDHAIQDITGLQIALDGKADDSDLDAKANVGDSYLKTETYAKTEVYNKTEIDQMTFDGGGSNVIVEDNLTSTSTTNALSSNQGRILDTTKADVDHTHDIAEVNGLQTELNGKSDINHTHTEYAPTVHSHDFVDITNKPLTYPPDAHVHAIADVTDLQTTLDGKADDSDLAGKSDVGHTHDFATEITNKPLTYPPDVHTHDFASITDKPASYPPDAHSHTSAEITDFATGVANNIPLEYLTETEGDARYQATGTIPAHDHPEYLTSTEGDALYQPIGTVPTHTHTDADITFGTKNAKTYVDDADNYILFTVLDGLNLMKVTQAEYDAIATKDPNTLYFIVG